MGLPCYWGSRMAFSLLGRALWNFLLGMAPKESMVSGLTHVYSFLAVTPKSVGLLPPSAGAPACRNPPGLPGVICLPRACTHKDGFNPGLPSCVISGKSFHLAETQLHSCVCREPTSGPGGQAGSAFCASAKKFLRLGSECGPWWMAWFSYPGSSYVRKGLDFQSVCRDGVGTFNFLLLV